MIYFLIITNIILFISLIIILKKYMDIKENYYAEKDMYLYNHNKISMIEYHYRNFKEGQNPYTTLRDISNTLKDIYPKDL